VNRILLWRCDSQIRRLTLRDDFEGISAAAKALPTGDHGGRHLPGTEVGQEPAVVGWWLSPSSLAWPSPGSCFLPNACFPRTQ
jgi:hypothetical protein